MDSFINEKQQRLLTTVFYSSAEIPINFPFIVAANVSLFSHIRDLGIVPDVLLSLNIIDSKKWRERNVRSYLFWEFAKPPDIVIEIVSPTPGNELGSKLTDYAQFQGISYIPKNDTWFAHVNLGLILCPDKSVMKKLILLLQQ